MNNTFDINKYIQLKKDVKQHYSDIKLGEQSLYENQSNLFKPITDVTKEQTKAIQDKLTSNQETITNTLVPFTTNLQHRFDQLDNLQTFQYYDAPIEQSSPIVLDFNRDFTEEEKHYLTSQHLEMPSVVFEKRTPLETLEKIKSINHSIGQSKRYGKITAEDYEKATAVVKKYKGRINQILEGLKIPTHTGTGLIKQKRSRGRPKIKVDAIVYNDFNDLIEKLYEFTSSYKAGNKGVHNYIVEILDELMKHKVIGKSDYEDMHSNILT